MLFSSIPFLFYFLPWVLLAYFIVPDRFKNAVLLFSSLFFYGWGEPKYLLFMIFSILQGYFLGLGIAKYSGRRQSKLFLTASVLLSLGLLGYCKYADFFVENFNAVTGLSLPLLRIALPIGISFYTFQILSYVIDVYRGTVKAQKNFICLALYIAMFPQLIAGPIVRYADIEAELKGRRTSLYQAALGARRFVLGLSKKIFIANVLAEFVDIFKASQEKSLLFFWLYALACVLYIYFDFSGYSDMAIGLGKIFGFSFPENFNYPYISRSITEFWRRWHMTLGTWFRDYLYIPLGGNRVGKVRWLINIAVVWMATGLWHGAAWNFVFWGMMFAVLLMGEKLWQLWKKSRGLPKETAKGSSWWLRSLSHIYVLFFVILSFVIFDAVSLKEGFGVLGAMFGGGFAGEVLPFVGAETLYYLKSYGLVFALAILGATPLPRLAVLRLSRGGLFKKISDVLEPLVLLLLLAGCTAFLIDGSFNPFLYFRF